MLTSLEAVAVAVSAPLLVLAVAAEAKLFVL
jgi:hypothetical protein